MRYVAFYRDEFANFIVGPRMAMSRDEHAGQNQDIKIRNKPFERVEQFKYSRTTLTNQDSIQE